MGDAGYGGWNPRNDRSGSPESCGCLARATRNISPRSFARTKSERAPLRWGVIYVAEGGNCPRILCPACPRGHTFHPAVSMVNNVPRVVHLNDSSCLQLFWQLIAPPPPPPSLVEIYRVSSPSFQFFLPPLALTYLADRKRDFERASRVEFPDFPPLQMYSAINSILPFRTVVDIRAAGRYLTNSSRSRVFAE